MKQKERDNIPVLGETLSAIPCGVVVVPCTSRVGSGGILRGSSSGQWCWPAGLLVVTVSMAAALLPTVVFLLGLSLAGCSW